MEENERLQDHRHQHQHVRRQCIEMFMDWATLYDDFMNGGYNMCLFNLMYFSLQDETVT